MKNLFGAFVAFLLVVSLQAQEPDAVILSFQRDFAKASLEGKIEVVAKAEAEKSAAMGPFYVAVLDFTLRNADLLRDESALNSITATAAGAVGTLKYLEALPILRRVFMVFRDPSVRVASLRALAILGKGDSQVIETLNQFLTNQNNLQRTGLAPDLQTLSACIDSLATLGDGTSYPSLFATMLAAYPQEISFRAAEALRLIRGDYKKFLIDVVKRNIPPEKLTAFRAGMDNPAFSASERGELAEAALEISLGLFPSEKKEQDIISDLRYSAIRELAALRWTRATTLAVKHFYRVQTDYGKDEALKDRFIDAILFLGAMGSSEAAQALSLQIGLLNSDMERTRTFDQDILLAVITALGDLGDKVAFDYLLYIGYLPYPDHIKAAAREALNRLKW
ncbi:MAG: hypothetical protein WCT14_00410 [Treponemataceae bacterium]